MILRLSKLFCSALNCIGLNCLALYNVKFYGNRAYDVLSSSNKYKYRNKIIAYTFELNAAMNRESELQMGILASSALRCYEIVLRKYNIIHICTYNYQLFNNIFETKKKTENFEIEREQERNYFLRIQMMCHMNDMISLITSKTWTMTVVCDDTITIW